MRKMVLATHKSVSGTLESSLSTSSPSTWEVLATGAAPEASAISATVCAGTTVLLLIVASPRVAPAPATSAPSSKLRMYAAEGGAFRARHFANPRFPKCHTTARSMRPTMAASTMGRIIATEVLLGPAKLDGAVAVTVGSESDTVDTA